MKRNKIQIIIYSMLLVLLISGCIRKQAPSDIKRETSTPDEQSAVMTDTEAEFYTQVKTKLKKAGLFPYDSPKDVPIVDFTLENLNGEKVSLSDFKGQTVLINFWATWCGPCRQEMPSMEALYKDMMNEGFVLLGINVRENKQTVQKYVTDAKLSFPVLLDTTGEIGGIYGASSIPLSYLIDTEGYIVGAVLGVINWNTSSMKDLIQFIQAR